eukprot:2697590-Pyramimonas_sp.AAC.1
MILAWGPAHLAKVASWHAAPPCPAASRARLTLLRHAACPLRFASVGSTGRASGSFCSPVAIPNGDNIPSASS